MSAIGPSAPRPIDPARGVERVRRPGREDGSAGGQRERQRADDERSEEHADDGDGRVHIDLKA